MSVHIHMVPALNIRILSVCNDNYSNKRLLEASRLRGHNASVVHTLFHTLSDQNLDFFDNQYNVDAVIPRIGGPLSNFGSAVIKSFESEHIFSTSSSYGIATSMDKFLTTQVLAANSLPVLKTITLAQQQHIDDVIRYLGGYPIVLKLLSGSQGKSVIYIDNAVTGKSLIQSMINARQAFLVQEFVKEAGGADIRCLVVGGRVVAAMKRQGAEGEFRSNLHRGGSAEVVKLTKVERETAVNAAKVMGLHVCGVDLLRSQNGPMVMEVNSSPGLEGIEKATGKDVASMVFEFIEKNAKPNSTKTRGKG